MHRLLIALLAVLALFSDVLSAAPFYFPPRRSIAPYVSGDTFRAYADFAYDELSRHFSPASVKKGNTIFVSGDFVPDFFLRIHPSIREPYILITHNSDFSFPGEFFSVLDDSKLIAWFTQNQDETVHPKLHSIPIGLENRQWKPTNVETLQKTNAMQLAKSHLAYCNIAVSSYPLERTVVQALLSHAPFVYCCARKNYDPFIEDLASSKFVISPRGNGLDTHRIWESLYVGSFPIVKTSSLNTLYEGLPIVIINDWTEVTEEFLHRKYNELTSQPCCYEKLYTDYWFRLIDSYKKGF